MCETCVPSKVIKVRECANCDRTALMWIVPSLSKFATKLQPWRVAWTLKLRTYAAEIGGPQKAMHICKRRSSKSYARLQQR